MTWFVCTGNAGKLREFETYLQGGTAPRQGGRDVAGQSHSKPHVVGVREIEAQTGQVFVEPDEPFDLFLANAACKLLAAFECLARVREDEIQAQTERFGEQLGQQQVHQQGEQLGELPTAQRVSPVACGVTGVIVDDSGLCCEALGFAPGVHSATFGGEPRSDAANRKALRAAVAHHFSASHQDEAEQNEALQHGALKQDPNKEFRLDAFFVCFLLSVKITPEWLDAFRASVKKGLKASACVEPHGHIADLEAALLSVACEPKPIDPQTPHTLSATCHLPLASFIPNLSDAVGKLEVAIHFGFCQGEISTHEQALLVGAGHGYDAMFYPRAHPELSFASVSLESKNSVSHRARALEALKVSVL